MSAIIYKVDNLEIIIAKSVGDKFVAIGPEFKKGIMPCVAQSDFDIPIVEHKKRDIGCSDRCLDVFETLKDNFHYYGKLEDRHLLGCLALYWWIAKYCRIEHLVPNVLMGLMEFSTDFEIGKVLVAKELENHQVSAEKIREWYFVQLGMQASVKELVAGEYPILVTEFIPGIIKYNVISDENQFNSMIKNLAETIEHNMKYLNFLHGSTHIGHITIDGRMIDFGESFNMYDKQMMVEYLTKYLPLKMRKSAISKYKIQNIDVVCACTLVELHIFFESYISGTTKYPNLIRFKKNVMEMDAWVMDLLERYFFDEDLSIFTITRTTNFRAIFGGFDIPDEPDPISEIFPIQHFLAEFSLAEIGEHQQSP